MDTVDIDALKKESLHKARNAWKSIIDKLSSLSESQQGDTIDLRTGKIIKDTGHLRSLKVNKDDLWATFPSNSHSDNENNGLNNNPNTLKKPKNTKKKTLITPKSDDDSNKNSSNNKIKFIDLSSPPKIPQNYHSHPGDTSYIVTSSQHMTRSKVTGDDVLIVKKTLNNSIKKKNKNSKISKYNIKKKKRVGSLDERADDPLNILDTHINIETPSKVRRLRKALDHSFKYKNDDYGNKERRHLHKLILQSKSTVK
ncbi:hypothetical protein C6P40_001949 [Pichia californica]|uniref:Uncharacterized protein n=1 Tax=Pichia californica TaxID=460514 RepID=A0A9P6WIT9_9ASCO|nr:hypothetical protein C6P42_001928 [[Candida] californica]KAG0687731.1 hypothetical protein C6P40_001949 [[Candida] californica]